MSAVIRGGQRNPVLQSFQPLQLQLRGRNELRTLTTAEVDGPAVPLRGETLFCGFYLNELLVRLLHREEPLPSLFEAYEVSLDLLSQAEQPADVVLRHFEFRLLDVLGYGVSLDQDSCGVMLEPECYYRLVPEEGLVKDMGGNFAGRYLNDVASGEWHDDSRRTARDLMREALAPHLGGRPLESRKLFRHNGRG